MREERIQKGVHFLEGGSSLSAKDTREVLRGLNQAGLEEYLKSRPLKQLSVEPLPQPPKGFLAGQYDETAEELYLHPTRPKQSFGQGFNPKRLEAFSQTAPNKVQAIKYTLIHEVAHHLLKDLIAREGWLKRLTTAFEQGNYISSRAADGLEEYFCEGFAAHTFNLAALKNFDPTGYAIIEEARQELKLK